MMRKKFTKFYIEYSRQGSSVWNGLKMFAALTEEEAHEIAREVWVENWNFCFPQKPNGKEEIKNYVFRTYASEPLKSRG